MQIFVENSFQRSLDEETQYSVTVGLQKVKWGSKIIYL